MQPFPKKLALLALLSSAFCASARAQVQVNQPGLHVNVQNNNWVLIESGSQPSLLKGSSTGAFASGTNADGLSTGQSSATAQGQGETGWVDASHRVWKHYQHVGANPAQVTYKAFLQTQVWYSLDVTDFVASSIGQAEAEFRTNIPGMAEASSTTLSKSIPEGMDSNQQTDTVNTPWSPPFLTPPGAILQFEVYTRAYCFSFASGQQASSETQAEGRGSVRVRLN